MKILQFIIEGRPFITPNGDKYVASRNNHYTKNGEEISKEEYDSVVHAKKDKVATPVSQTSAKLKNYLNPKERGAVIHFDEEKEYHAFFSDPERVEKLIKTLEKANKILENMGLPKITYTKKEGVFKSMTDVFGRERHGEGTEITIKTSIDKITKQTGFAYLGKIEHDTGVINAKDETINLEEFLDRQVCDHCGKRHARTKSFIIQDIKTGKVYQVGSSCLNNYFPKELTPVKLNALTDLFDDLRNLKSDKGRPLYNPKNAVLTAKAVVDTEGFVSSQSNGMTSKTVLQYAMSGNIDKLIADRSVENGSKLTKKIAQYNSDENYDQEDEDFFNDVMKFLKEREHSSTFYGNVYRLLSAEGGVKSDKLGFLPAAVFQYQKDKIFQSNAKTEKELEQERDERVINSKSNPRLTHKVGDKLSNLELKLDKRIELDGYYGRTYINMMSDADGNIYTWKTSNGSLGSGKDEESKDIILSGKIKAFNEYPNRKTGNMLPQTEMKNCDFKSRKDFNNDVKSEYLDLIPKESISNIGGFYDYGEYNIGDDFPNEKQMELYQQARDVTRQKYAKEGFVVPERWVRK